MNICILGDGLTSLSLAKNLINKKINVHIYQNRKINNSLSSRTIGISKNNLKFFEKEIHKLPKKIKWEIKKIEIYSEKLKKNKILNFENDNKSLFYMVKNDALYESLYKKLSKNKLFNRVLIKDKFFYDKLLKNDNYDLIINCNQENPISKKYFIKKIYKDYKNLAYTTILEHKKLKNDSAIQVFTDLGPIAFLPISSTKTSVVFSIDIENKSYNDTEILDLIKKYNPKYKIKKILGLSNFELNSSNLRNYYHKNILAFGDSLHRIHPLAGQGFNMIIRDIKNLSKIIQNKIELGIQLDSIILEEFERKTKNSNFIFSNGIDFIYEIFNNDKKNKNQNLNKALKIFGRNEKLMNSIIRYADSGLNI
jgi:2-octaprenyl-6-methoxyphenol hydroxylase